MRDVSVLIITFNSSSTIKNCLLSLNDQMYKSFQVILLDNNSIDKTKEMVESVKPTLNFEIETFYIARNLGFSSGNNLAFRYAISKYIALLNPDAFAEKSWLGNLTEAIERDPDVGLCASKIISHGANIVDSAGDGFSTSLKGFKRGEGESASLFKREEYVFGACAGAALYRRKMIEEIGFFDENFFLIHEDTDLNYRAQLHGWKTLYIPTAIVYHKVRSSIGNMSDMAIYYTLRNSEFVRIKNVPLGVFIRCIPDFLIGALTEFLYFAIKHRRSKLYFKAKKDAIRILPRMLKKRAVVMKSRKVGNKYLLNIMTPVWQKDFFSKKIKKFLHA